MNNVELGWVAGLHEGEGSCIVIRNGTGRLYAKVSLGSTDLDVLEKLQALVGGNIHGPFRLENPRHKPYWNWSLTDTRGAAIYMEAVYPLLCERRQGQIDAVRSALEEQGPVVKATLDERFDALTVEDGDCVRWTGHVDQFGFGTWCPSRNKRTQAHRWAYQRECGSVPSRLKPPVCGRKDCVQVSHWREANK